MNRLNWRAWSLSARLSLLMTALLLIGIFLTTILSVLREQDAARRDLETQATLLLNTLRVSTSDALYQLDADFLIGLMRDWSRSESSIEARIYDQDGRLIADSSAPEQTFSTRIDPFGDTIIQTRGVSLLWEEGRLLAGESVTAGSQVFGAVSVALPTTRLNERLSEAQFAGRRVLVIVGLAGALLIILFSRTIIRPLKALTAASEQIAAGNFNQRVEEKGGLEIEGLARSFNSMTARLRESIATLEQHSRELAHNNLELIIARERAEDATRMKSQFLATMSHELRTPLNAIIGYTEIIGAGMAGPINDEQRVYHERVLHNAEHLLKLINDILDLSKIEAGRTEIVRQPFHTQEWAKEVISQTRGLAEQKGLNFVTEVDSTLPPLLLGDAVRLKQIAINLLANAVKFTEKGQVGFTVKRQSQTTWAIIVSDTGIGIPPHMQELIFDEFRQVDGSPQREHGGSGLGLAIVRKLVMLMGGNIRLNSALDSGSTFTVTMPLDNVQPAQEERVSASLNGGHDEHTR